MKRLTVNVKELEILDSESPRGYVSSIVARKLCDEHGYSFEWIHGQKPHLIKNGIRIQCNTESLRKQLTSRPDHLWPELWKSMGKHSKLKGKQKWSNEKLHLESERKLLGIYFIDPEDKEFKETIKNARKKLETPVAPAMPCKILKNCGSGASNKIKTKLACILEADESTRMRMGIQYRIIMRTTLQEKEKIHYSTTIWFTNLIPCLKQ